MSLISKTRLGPTALQNHLVMSPMTRNRATGKIPNGLMAQYYAQHASAGLIITEGTSPSPNGLGYPRIPGIYSAEQVAGWKKVTRSVSASGGKIFVQLMHTGRVGHPLNLPAGARVLGPSAVAAREEIYTDAEGMKPLPTPQSMTEATYAQPSPSTLRLRRTRSRQDLTASNYTGRMATCPSSSSARRPSCAPMVTVAESKAARALSWRSAAAGAIGKDKVGIRLSPFGVFMPLYPEIVADYSYLAE